MKGYLVFIVCLLGLNLFSQDSKIQICNQISVLEEAMKTNNQDKLKLILHQNLYLGHSNGWIETKDSMLKDLQNSKVKYHTFSLIDDVEFIFISDDYIITRRKTDVEGLVNGNNFKVKLTILENWILTDSIWQLIARQSVNRKE